MTHPHEGLQERALREVIAKALYDLRPACGHRNEGRKVLNYAIAWDDAHGIHRQDAYDEADTILTAIAASTPTIPQDQGLRDALEPFAMEASEYDNDDGEPDYKNAPDESSLEEINELTVGHLRRARKAWSAAGYATFPQQAATDEGEAWQHDEWLTTILDDVQRALAKGIYGRTLALSALREHLPRSTPTSQPPAAETRLREALQEYAAFAGEVAGTSLGLAMSSNHPSPDTALMGMFDKSQALASKHREALAALTQPEPTAQQEEAMNGSEKVDFAEFYDLPIEALSAQQEDETVRCSKCDNPDMRMCDCSLPSRVEPAQQGGDEGAAHDLCHADGCSLAHIPLRLASCACGRTAQQATEVFGYGADGEPMRRFKGAAQVLSEALSAQQAAGEAEAVVTVEAVCSNRPRPTVARSGKHGGGQWWARDVWHIAAAENKTLCGLDRSDWLTIGQTKLNSDCCKRCSRLYATPQPTETQRIVAWLRSASQAARDHHAEVCRHEDDEILDAIITRMETYAFAADQIERGVHLPSSEHLAGESK